MKGTMVYFQFPSRVYKEFIYAVFEFRTEGKTRLLAGFSMTQ